MGTGKQRRSRTHGGTRHIARQHRTRHRTKDLDQIHEDLKPENQGKLLEQQQQQEEEDMDLPGMGQFYCIECSRHFVNQDSLDKHKVSKQHKSRIKQLRTEPYTIEEAERAGGLGRGGASPLAGALAADPVAAAASSSGGLTNREKTMNINKAKSEQLTPLAFLSSRGLV